MTKEEILDALKAVKYPPYNKDIVSFGMVKYVKIDGKKAEINPLHTQNSRSRSGAAVFLVFTPRARG